MDYAFRNCTSLTSITLPTFLRNGVFSGCTSLSEITIPQNVNNLRSDVFADCTNLKKINIESPSVAPNITPGTIFPYATTVNFGENVTNIGSRAFASHANLEEVTFASPCEIYPSSFNNCRKLRTVNGTVIPTGTQCFADCSQLASIEIDGSTSTIGTFAFSGCRGLTKVVCHNPEPVALTSTMYVFANVPVANVKLDVPYSSMSAYKSAEVWKDFGDFFAIGGVKLQDGVAYTNTEDYVVPMVRYTRNFTNTEWQALYIPFSMKYEDWKDKFEVARLNDVHQWDDDDDGNIDRTVLEHVRVTSGSIQANRPYIIKAKVTGEQTIEVVNTTLKAAESNSIDCSSVETLYTFTGTYEEITVDPYTHYAYAGGKLVQTSVALPLGSYRWYLDITDRYSGSTISGANIRVRIDGEDDETSLESIFENNANVRVHSLDGKLVKILSSDKDIFNSELPSGIYIINGKKVQKI